MENIKVYDLVIIGGGSAGMAAAISAKENGVNDILILEKDGYLGGILPQCIHNGFGLYTFKEQLSGPEYAQRFIDRIVENKIEYKLNTYVLSISREKDIFYSNNQEGFCHIKAKTIIMATGCIERTPGQIQLEGARVAGIMTAGLAQRYLNIEGYLVGKRIFILGSGDIGLIMARRMSLEGAKVVGVAELMPYSNGLSRNVVQCLKDFDIPLYLSHTVKQVLGKDHVEKVIIAQVDEKLNYIPGSEKEFECDTLILSVGLIPYNMLLGQIGAQLSPTMGAAVDNNYQTSLDGIFSCGNVLHVHDLVDYVSEEASLAGIGAAKYLKGMIKKDAKATKCVNGNGVSYVVPQIIRKDDIDEKVTFKFRVRKPFTNASIVIKCDDNTIRTIKKIKMLPAEMETVTLKKDELLDCESLSFEVMEDMA